MDPAFDLTALLRVLGKEQNLVQTLATLDRLSSDRHLHMVVDPIRLALQEGRVFFDLACALQCIAQHGRPRTFLEIGIRKGKSMAQVSVSSPDCDVVGVDLWITPYGGVENPGPDYVRAEIARLGHRGTLQLYSGNSRDILPKLFAEKPDLRFDLINVDGDHSNEGAWFDLTQVRPRLTPGGFLVFDDLVHPQHTLMEVWIEFQSHFTAEFEFFTNASDRYGTGIAWKRPPNTPRRDG